MLENSRNVDELTFTGIMNGQIARLMLKVDKTLSRYGLEAKFCWARRPMATYTQEQTIREDLQRTRQLSSSFEKGILRKFGVLPSKHMFTVDELMGKKQFEIPQPTVRDRKVWEWVITPKHNGMTENIIDTIIARKIRGFV